MQKLIDCGTFVDLTVTSPPYDDMRTYKGTLDWSQEIWENVIKKLYEITKDGGVVVWNCNDATLNGTESGTSLKQALFFMECGFNLHDTMIWNKGAGGGAVGSNKCYTQRFEYMFIFSKGKIKTFNLIEDVENKSFGVVFKCQRRKKNGEKDNSRRGRPPNKKLYRRSNVWQIPTQPGGEHPATFPDVLAGDHIETWSNPGDVVLDPFMGSGTTGKMAIIKGRDFIGIEKVLEYYDISKDKISATQDAECASLASEICEIEDILDGLAADAVIERMSFEARLDGAKEALKKRLKPCTLTPYTLL